MGFSVLNEVDSCLAVGAAYGTKALWLAKPSNWLVLNQKEMRRIKGKSCSILLGRQKPRRAPKMKECDSCQYMPAQLTI